jgi:long-chain acyl-CoA synthetase
MRNYPEWSLAYTAITSIGAIAVAVNAWWEADEIEYAVKHTGVSLIIADQERVERIEKISPRLDTPIIATRCDATEIETTPIASLLDSDVEMPAVDIQPDDDAVILFTSGSTGRPKGSVSTHRNVIAALLSWEADYAAIAALLPEKWSII